LRILYFSPRDCWPLTTGARLRDYHLAQGLAVHSQLSYLALTAPGAPRPAPLPPEAGFEQILIERDASYTPAKLLGGLLGPVPVTLRNYSSARAAQALTDLLAREDYDIVQIEGIHLAEYVRVIRRGAPRAAIVADWHNIESELMARYAETVPSWPKRIYAQRTAALIERSEQRLLRECDLHTVVSERERQKLLARCPEARIEVVPNGVDLGFYSQISRDPSTARNIIFVGSMDYHANIDAAVWLVGSIWPLVRGQSPGGAARLQIVGRQPVAEVRALAAADVEITGTVEDVRPYYAGALTLVVPLRVGGGTRLKILEAMAAGVPVISTALGAEGIDAENDVHIFIRDSEADIFNCIQALQTDPELGKRVAEAGKRLAYQKYSWKSITKDLRLKQERLTKTRK